MTFVRKICAFNVDEIDIWWYNQPASQITVRTVKEKSIKKRPEEHNVSIFFVNSKII